MRNQIPTLAEVRATVQVIRGQSVPDSLLRPARRAARDPDRDLLDLMGDPFESVGDVLERLGDAEALLRSRSDRRSVFLTVYTEMTATVERGIESGYFDYPDWVSEYLTTFANWYRTALVDFERGDLARVPDPWRLGFHASTSGYTVLVQDALLGINAHINYDLPYTLREVAIDPNRSAKRRDHDRINGILATLVDVVQRALIEVYDAGGYAHVDALMGTFDEDFTLVGLTEARDLAWRNAVVLTDTGSSLVRRLVDWRVRIVATGAAYFVLGPSADRTVLWALRQVEGDDPPIEDLREVFRRRASDRSIGIE